MVPGEHGVTPMMCRLVTLREKLPYTVVLL